MLGLKRNLVSKYDYVYMIIMVLYMAQMTEDTARMVGNLSGSPISFLIPIVATFFLVRKHRLNFSNKNLYRVCALLFVWSILVIFKMSLFTGKELSYYFFLFYAVVIAYIHIQAYGNKFFQCYEEVIVLFSKIALVGWLICNLLPGPASAVMHQFQPTHYGNNFLYIFHWMDPAKDQVYRNAGCSWEPGRFAIMVVLGIVVNLSREGIRFKKNKNIIWLLLTLLSTMSTTGYITTMTLYSLYWIKKWNVKYIMSFVVVFIPVLYFLSTLEFIGDKISKRMDVNSLVNTAMVSIDYSNSIGEGDEYKASLDRFESIYFEVVENILHDPILGYGRNTDNSYYSKNISKAFTLTGGLAKLFGQYGLVLGCILYIILYKSSLRFAHNSINGKPMALMIVILFSSISYVIFCIPIFTAFWFYYLFEKNKCDTVNFLPKRNQ